MTTIRIFIGVENRLSNLELILYLDRYIILFVGWKEFWVGVRLQRKNAGKRFFVDFTEEVL
jgi:hypothetical protein